MTTNNDQKISPKIIVIDDEELITDLIKMYLLKGGYENVHVFNDSVEAMDILMYAQVDLIVTDVNMPDLGGKFIAKLAKKYESLRDVPIIVVSSDESPETRESLIGNGVAEILYKPIKERDLLLAVTKLLDSPLPALEDTRSKTLGQEAELRRAFNRNA